MSRFHVHTRVFVHVFQNIRFEGVHFADNGELSVFISRADNVEFDGTVFVGQSNVNPPHCRDFWDKVAITLHPVAFNEWTLDGAYRGTTLTNVAFQNWADGDTGCATGRSRPLEFNTDDIFVPQWAAPHTFTDVDMDASLRLDACKLTAEHGLDNISIDVFSDAHGSFGPGAGHGFLISHKVGTMLPVGACGPYDDCLDWCSGACLCTVNMRTGDSPMPEDAQVIVTDDNTGASIAIDRGMRASDPIHRHDAFFGVALPAGIFTAKFVRGGVPPHGDRADRRLAHAGGRPDDCDGRRHWCLDRHRHEVGDNEHVSRRTPPGTNRVPNKAPK